MIRNRLDYLAVADPDAAQRLGAHLTDIDPCAYAAHLPRIVDEVIEALAMEISFGRRLADGMGHLLAKGTLADLARYRRMVSTAATSGPTLAGLFARYLVPILIHGTPDLIDRFEATTKVMLQKGTYTLKAPLESLSALVQAKDIDCARAFLDLLATTYAQSTSYNRTVYLTHTLPRAVDHFIPPRRLWQIKGLTRVIREDERLADDYIQGCTAGLELLSESALNAFLDQAIHRHRHNPAQTSRFLSLGSHTARDVCRDLQVAVPLAAVQRKLERYAQARTGLAVSIRPLSALSDTLIDHDGKAPLVHCDGRAIYLPDEMDLMDRRADNADLYKLLVRLEVGAIEFGTFELDGEKALVNQPVGRPDPSPKPWAGQTDLAHFLEAFDKPMVALDLFTLFEHGRVAKRVAHRYPGLYRRLFAAQADKSLATRAGYRTGGTLFSLYRHLVMEQPLTMDPVPDTAGLAIYGCFNQMQVTDTVLTSARRSAECYACLASLADSTAMTTWQPLSLPFGRRIIPNSFGPFDTAHHRLAVDIHTRLAQRGIRVYRSELKDLLDRQGGRLSDKDIQAIVVTTPSATASVDLTWLNIASLACRHGIGQPLEDTDDANTFRYREWDWCMGDYLPGRVRVLARKIQGHDARFYGQTLDAYRGLVTRIRYAFELLRPEEITILRQWREGDAFDYRALLDYAMDKKAGRMPSDRLFVKRIKRVRDVAALLLVDLSRSTANAVDHAGTCVLDVEKQAIVLLCEALAVVGDRFAIAGFSGTGPLGVDYYRIKDLAEPFDDKVKGRISAMAPLRGTRMGAAIRHATAQLAPVPSRVRLILVLGDGYPNDLEYKGDYAVEDTRRAVMEARADAIHVKAITINVSDNEQLDRLYGKTHHTRIGHVRDLPDKLVRVYSALTRH